MRRHGDVLDARRFARAAAGCDAIFHNAAAITPPRRLGGVSSARTSTARATRSPPRERRGARLLHVEQRRRVRVRARDTVTPGAEDRRRRRRSRRCPSARTTRVRSGSRRSSCSTRTRRGRIWATAVRPDVIYGRRDRQFVPRMARLLRRGIVAADRRRSNDVRRSCTRRTSRMAPCAPRRAKSRGGRGVQSRQRFRRHGARVFYVGAPRGLGRRIRFCRFRRPSRASSASARSCKALKRALTGGR